MSEPPANDQPKRSEAIHKDGVKLILKKCELCEREVYLAEKHSLCEKCMNKKKN